MSNYGVTGVRVDDHGHVRSVVLCEVDTANNRFVGKAREIAAHDAADKILAGDLLIPLFIVKENGWTVHGKPFKYKTFGDGRETIELDEEIGGRTIQDLVLGD